MNGFFYLGVCFTQAYHKTTFDRWTTWFATYCSTPLVVSQSIAAELLYKRATVSML